MPFCFWKLVSSDSVLWTTTVPTSSAVQVTGSRARIVLTGGVLWRARTAANCAKRQAAGSLHSSSYCAGIGLATPSTLLSIPIATATVNYCNCQLPQLPLQSDLCQGSKKVWDPGFAESKVWDLDGSWTLHVLFAVGLWKPRTSKLCYAARPWKPRTSRFWYAVRPWKPRTSKFW